jgi:hypothetical protein
MMIIHYGKGGIYLEVQFQHMSGETEGSQEKILPVNSVA